MIPLIALLLRSGLERLQAAVQEWVEAYERGLEAVTSGRAEISDEEEDVP